jgi:hypothetical protein
LLRKDLNVTVTLLRLSPPDKGNEDNPDPLGTPCSPEKLAQLLASPQAIACRYLPGNPEPFVIAGGGALALDIPSRK